MTNRLLFYCVCFLVTYGKVLRHSSAMPTTSVDLCGSEREIELTKSGEASSMVVTLLPIDQGGVCKLKVSAPKTHAINMQFIDVNPELEVNHSMQNHPPCVMSIILPENPRIPVWKGDPCSQNALTEVELLTSDFKIIWNPPSDPAATNGRKFILTAVGQGDVCKEPGQHTCMRIGWDPMMCVADHLLCNGFENCPKSSTTSDEDEKLCKKSFFARTSLEKLAMELFKKWKPPELANNKWLQEKLEQHISSSSPSSTTKFSWNDWQQLKKTETTSVKPVGAKTKATDSISQVLSKYGPWGYLMLGMLICGTVLMFCGLWECCFRKPKTEIGPPSTQTQPTTVLIMNLGQEEAGTPNPPNYDDLDQPPSYMTLFPNFKATEGSSDESAGRSGTCDQQNEEHVTET